MSIIIWNGDTEKWMTKMDDKEWMTKIYHKEWMTERDSQEQINGRDEKEWMTDEMISSGWPKGMIRSGSMMT